MFKVQLGDRAKDRISGLTGIVTGRSEFLYGCKRITITPESCKDGKPAEGFWVDEAQVDVLVAGAIVGFGVGANGSDAPAGPQDDHMPRVDATR